jgi:hypothetical protein
LLFLLFGWAGLILDLATATDTITTTATTAEPARRGSGNSGYRGPDLHSPHSGGDSQMVERSWFT